MLKRPITYETFNGETVTETFYFNLTMPEFVALKTDPEDEDVTVLVAMMDKIILFSYGLKSEDGKHFKKSDELREDFESSAAYASFFTELAMDEKKTLEFLRGVLPKQLGAELNKINLADAPPAISPSL